MTVKSEERLPDDWTEELKVEKNGRQTKYYMNVRTGQKFYSKEDLLRYVNMRRTQLDEPHPTKGPGKRHSENTSSKHVAKVNNHENSRSKRHSGNKSTNPVSRENNHENQDRRHPENTSTKFIAKENNHENSCGKSQLENGSMKPVADENSFEYSLGKRPSESCSMKSVAEENNRPEWLPEGWIVDLKTRKSGSAMGRQYKIYIEPLTGCKFFSMPEVLRHLESARKRNSECETETTPVETSNSVGAGEASTKTVGETKERDVVAEKSSVDDLPPGWVKETKTRKTARGTRKDHYYTDPVSGYVFVSKKEVFRYLETGEISKYAFKPRKTGTDDPEQVTEEALPSPDAKRQQLDYAATKRQLFPGKESSEAYNAAITKTKVSKKKRGKDVSAEIGIAGAPAAQISPEPMAKRAIDKGVESKDISSLSDSALPKIRRSKRNQGKLDFADNGLVSTPVIDSLQGQRILESHIKCGDEKTQNDSTKSAKKKKLQFPLRSSKRLAGLEPEKVSERMSIEEAPKNVTTESCKSRAVFSAGLVGEVYQHRKAGSKSALASHMSSDKFIASTGQPSNKFKSSGSRAIRGEQLQKFKSAESTDDKAEQVSLFFGKSYLDPCLEPAFKALMGELPLNSNPENGPVLNPTAGILQETSTLMTERGERSIRRTRGNTIQSKNKQELSLPRRSSKRLAGFEPELTENCKSLERAHKNVTTESCKSERILAAGLTSSGLGDDEVSQQLKAGPVLGLPNRASALLGLAGHMASNGEPSNKFNSSGSLAITSGQSAEAKDDKSEPLLSLPFGVSDMHPCNDPVPGIDPVSTSIADILPGKKLHETKVEKSSNKKTRINSRKSKNKQDLNLPRRSSKRLAGAKSELVSNLVSGEQDFGNATIESCKYETTTYKETDPCGSADDASLHVDSRHETVLAQADPPDIFTLLLEKTSGKNSKPPESTSHHVDSGHETVLAQLDPPQIVTPSLEKSSGKSSNPPESTSHHVDSGHQKMLAQLDPPQLVSPSLEMSSGKSSNPPESTSHHVDFGHEKMHAQLDPPQMITPLLEKSSGKSSKPPEVPTVSQDPSQKLENEKPEEQPQKLETEKMDIQNPDSQIILPFGDSWSDPCLEFAFKTLTGAIPVDENLAIRDYFQHQLDNSNSQKEDSLALPDFGPINSFQSEVSHQLDTPEKQPSSCPQQQGSTNPSPPTGNVSNPSCSGIDLNNLA